MTTSIELSVTEAIEACTRALEAQGGDFSVLTSATQASAIAGTIAIVGALQAMGYRITRPLREAKESG
jgi:hypothetical protein